MMGLPSWATGKEADVESPDANITEESVVSSSKIKSAVGSLERELRQRVFELEEQVFQLEGRLSIAGDTTRLSSDEADGAVTGVKDIESFASDGGAGERDASSLALIDREEGEEESDGNVEEMRLVDQEIEDKVRYYNVYNAKYFAWFCSLMKRYVLLQVKFHMEFMWYTGTDFTSRGLRLLQNMWCLLGVFKERELLVKAEQARAYEAMKGQFEGLLGRLQVRIENRFVVALPVLNGVGDADCCP